MIHLERVCSHNPDLGAWLDTSVLLGIVLLGLAEVIALEVRLEEQQFPLTPLWCLMFPTAVLKEGCN